jgi:hypothetical protein
MDIFSPVPFIDLKESTTLPDDIDYIYRELETCCQYNLIHPIYPDTHQCSVFVIVDNTSSESRLLEKNPKFIDYIKRVLNTDNVYFSSTIKTNLNGTNKNKLNKQCSKCGIDTITKEIELLKPKLIINCNSQYAKKLGKDKFMDSFGKIFKTEKFECYYLNSPSPNFVKFKDEIKDEFMNKINPLLKEIGNIK